MAIKTIQERQSNDSDFTATQGTTQGRATKKSAKRKQQADTKPPALISWTDHVVDHVLNLLGRDVRQPIGWFSVRDLI